MQKDHRFAAARAALQHETLPFGARDDIELLFLNGADDIADLHVVLAALDDAAQIGIEQDLLVSAADLFGRKDIAHGEIFVAEIEHLSVLYGERAAEHRAVFVLVDGERDAALLIIAHRKRRTPVDDLEIDVPFLADIIAVVALFFVHDVHAGEIGLGKEGFVAVEFFRLRGDERLLFLKRAVILRPVLLAGADLVDLRTRRTDAVADAGNIEGFEHTQYRGEMLLLVRHLLFAVEKREIPRFIGVDPGTEQIARALLFSHALLL